MSDNRPGQDLIKNFRQVNVKAGEVRPISPVLMCDGFQAQLLDENDTESDVAALDVVVVLQVFSRRPTVWTDLMGQHRVYDAHAGSFVHVPAQLASRWRVQGCGGRMLHMTFDPHVLRLWGEEEKLSPHMPPSLLWKDPELSALTMLISAELQARERQGKLYAQSLAVAAGIRILRRASASGARGVVAGGLAPRQLKRVRDHLMAHLAEDVTLAELAAIADLSPHHFCRAFRQSTGLPPHAWLVARRMERAQEMMTAHPDMGLIEIALAVGYQSQAAFGAAFRRATGLSPGQWRRGRA